MHVLRTHAARVGAVGAANLLFACSMSAFTAGTDASAPDAAVLDDASSANDDGVPAVPPPCDRAKSPAEDACVVTDALGVFVDGTHGDDANDGTKASPLKTLGAAVTKAGGKRIYACAGTYDESLVVKGTGVALFGGFACDTWAYGTTRAKVAPTAKGLALRVDGVTTARFEDVELVAQAGTAAGESSVTAYVSGSSGVVFRHVTLTAGAGVAGKAGATPTAALPVASDGVDGSKGGTAVTCVCGVGQSVGGKGGTASGNGGAGSPALGGGAGGDATKICNAGGAGGKGIDATSGARGDGAATYGTITDTGWTATSGGAGGGGNPGQGGGGGNSLSSAGVGGGGACGGCGGGGATAGDGGGSSIALLAKNSSLRFEESSLLTANGGNGGAGAAGQDGAAGSVKAGLGTEGCGGGTGGKGGAGGASGGGAGGLSAGVVYVGTEPTLDDATTTSFAHGTAGTGGKGGVAGTNDGKAGTAAVKVALP